MRSSCCLYIYPASFFRRLTTSTFCLHIFVSPKLFQFSVWSVFYQRKLGDSLFPQIILFLFLLSTSQFSVSPAPPSYLVDSSLSSPFPTLPTLRLSPLTQHYLLLFPFPPFFFFFSFIFFSLLPHYPDYHNIALKIYKGTRASHIHQHVKFF